VQKSEQVVTSVTFLHGRALLADRVTGVDAARR